MTERKNKLILILAIVIIIFALIININYSTGHTTRITACNDNLDNDGDTYIDTNDPGCRDRQDNSERSNIRCDDGTDNDVDGLTDYPNDPGCISPRDNGENENTYECDNNRDDDNDGRTDYRVDGRGDQQCTSVTDNDERTTNQTTNTTTNQTTNTTTNSTTNQTSNTTLNITFNRFCSIDNNILCLNTSVATTNVSFTIRNTYAYALNNFNVTINAPNRGTCTSAGSLVATTGSGITFSSNTTQIFWTLCSGSTNTGSSGQIYNASLNVSYTTGNGSNIQFFRVQGSFQDLIR